jgi:ubiquinone/menaquinone biosynthesis C-methylase UbiE
MNFKKRAANFWNANPAGRVWGESAEPGTKEYFEQVLERRSSYEIPWLFEVVPFASFRDKSLLEVGCGAGYDAYHLCLQGARYTGIDLAPENPRRTQRHLGYYGFSPQVLLADAESLCFRDRVFDVVFSNGVLHHTPDIDQSFREAHRVLKTGGEFWVILYHKHSIFYWVKLLAYQHVLKLGFLRRSFAELLSGVEYGDVEQHPLVTVVTRKGLQAKLEKSGFLVQSMKVRKLLHEDLPASGRLSKLYQPIPQKWLDSLGKVWGWYVIAQAVKP